MGTGVPDTCLQGRMNDETSLYNYRARLYDPVLKRFLDTDPAGQGFTPYAYAGNNHVMIFLPIFQGSNWYVI